MSFSTEVLLRGEETGGQVAIVENRLPPQWAGPPLHKHDFDEGFYVLEGEITFQVGPEVVVRRVGEVAFAPRNAVHTLANHSDEPARYVLVITPAGFERYFARMTDDPPAWALQPFPETIVVGAQIPSTR
jgi:quercetin dioxygenase-like cupin family protein